MIFPIEGQQNVNWRITKPFQRGHPGIDIAPIPAGTKGIPCLAPLAATVIASTAGTLEGNYVILQVNAELFYYFGHFERRLVTVGQRVSEGQQIGILGMTGPTSGPNKVTGIHTHHEVRTSRYGSQINPEVYYKKQEDEVESFKDTNDVRVNGFELFGITGVPNADLLKWVGKSKLEFFKGLGPQVQNTINSLNRRISELEGQGSGGNCTADERAFLDAANKLYK